LRRKFQIGGIVQGVGFRPWVYQLAQRHRLSGYVFNSTLGVTIEVEGQDEDLDRFESALRSEAPPLAEPGQIRVEHLEPSGYREFTIRDSEDAAGEFVLVPPDIATCADCLADLRDPANRRYRYPFTNCTNCGPRYTIIQEIPYDRPHTTMAGFRQCPDCEREYHDPSDRRFHAQPNACPACGPWVELWDAERMLAQRAGAIEGTRRLLKEGAILAIKGLGGFHLACDAANDAAVGRLRQRKLRSGKPFALMAASLEKIAEFCQLAQEERAALSGTRRPIVLLERRPASRISGAVAPGVPTLGVMLPYTPLHHLLFEGGEFDALVMTSANLSEEPIAYRNEEVAARLHPLADFFLLHNRAIQTRVDDSVVRIFEGRERLLRRSRGYAPRPIELGFAAREVLACGGELKNTFCLTKAHYAILSQHTGDLENLETLEFFRRNAGSHEALLPRGAARRRARSAPAIHDHPAGPGDARHRKNRRAAPSRPHRGLHGREWIARESARRSSRWHRIRNRRADLGRRVSDLRLSRGSSGGFISATCRWPAVTRPSGSRGAPR
jgi:hydrogenase maturation protein HypF